MGVVVGLLHFRLKYYITIEIKPYNEKLKMNKAEFVTYIANQHDCKKVEAEKAIDMFTSSVISAIGENNEISLIGFGHFSTSKVAARNGRNPRSGEAIQINAYNQAKFKAGQKLKDACNK